jgi:hypothetical protein
MMMMMMMMMIPLQVGACLSLVMLFCDKAVSNFFLF